MASQKWRKMNEDCPVKTKTGKPIFFTLACGLLLHDNGKPDIAALTRNTLAGRGWTYNPDLYSCDYIFFVRTYEGITKTKTIWKAWRSRGAGAQLAYNSAPNCLCPRNTEASKSVAKMCRSCWRPLILNWVLRYSINLLLLRAVLSWISRTFLVLWESDLGIGFRQYFWWYIIEKNPFIWRWLQKLVDGITQ